MAIYQSESVIEYLKKGLEDGTVVMYAGDPAHFVSQKDGVILPNGDLYDRGQSFYAWMEKQVIDVAPVKPAEKPVEEPKAEEKPAEEPKVEAPAPKTRKPAAKKAAE
jgi:hypothetical protein